MKQRALTFLAALALAVPVMAAEVAAEGGHEAANNPFAGDIGNALWTLIIFTAVVLVLGKFAWGPILAALQQREGFIRESLEQARRDREAAEARLAEYEQRLAASRAEASAIVDEGRRDAEVVKRRIEEDARAEAERIIARGKREIQIATDTAIQEIYSVASRLATQAAAKVLEREIDPKDHERLIAQSIEQLAAMPAAPGHGRPH